MNDILKARLYHLSKVALFRFNSTITKLSQSTKQTKLILVCFALFLIWFIFFSLPADLFEAPKSLVLYDRNGQLLYASVAEDEQWRFPKIDSVSSKLATCVTQYEDEYFYYHLGVNPISIVKSFFLNLKSTNIKRGGSTITMQTIRILQKNPSRTYGQKIKEIILALRFELFNSKKTILEYYVSNAPYGGNVVGVEAAAWRYFGKSSHSLSWSEAAMMAVLPNQPSYIYPGKNQEKLLKKRNLLLKKLLANKSIDEFDYQLAIEEPLPQKVHALPTYAYHLAQELDYDQNRSIIHTTIDHTIQKKVDEILDMYHHNFKSNQINNLSAIVIDATNGETLAYIGNTRDTVEGHKINMITRPRSSGSTLKPLLFANMLDEGLISTQSLLQDIPIDINGYEPNNSSYKFDGVVPAYQALCRSLNIPWILALKNYGYEKFYNKLKRYEFQHFTKSARHYGLSLVVGGGEVELKELANTYLQLSNHLQGKNQSKLSHFIQGKENQVQNELDISRGAIWLTMEAMTNISRPENEENWEYRQSQKIAWKTGTSHGFRDAWAIGVNPRYVIGVWVGNSEGHGRSNLTGIKKAAPILFDILNSLPAKSNKWFTKPVENLKKIQVCKESGYAKTEFCQDVIELEYPLKSELKVKCPYHTSIFLDSSETYQVHASCYPTDKMKEKSWFKLPLVEESYYRQINPLYRLTPPLHPLCHQVTTQNMEIIFPKNNATIIAQTSSISHQIVLQAVHRVDSAKVHWFLDNQYLQTTIKEHKVSVEPAKGRHSLTIQDGFGNFKSVRFVVE